MNSFTVSCVLFSVSLIMVPASVKPLWNTPNFGRFHTLSLLALNGCKWSARNQQKLTLRMTHGFCSCDGVAGRARRRESPHSGISIRIFSYISFTRSKDFQFLCSCKYRFHLPCPQLTPGPLALAALTAPTTYAYEGCDLSCVFWKLKKRPIQGMYFEHDFFDSGHHFFWTSFVLNEHRFSNSSLIRNCLHEL